MKPRIRCTLTTFVALLILLAPTPLHSWQSNRWLLGLVAQAEQEWLHLEEVERLAAELPEGNWRGRVALARVAVRAGVPGAALGWLEPEVQQPRMMKARAEALAALGRWEEAYQCWAEAGDTRALSQAGDEAFAAGREEDGLAARQAWFEVEPIGAALPLAEGIRRVERNPRKSAEFLLSVANRHRNAPLTTQQTWWHRAGDFFRVAKEWERAENAYARLEAMAPADWRPAAGRAWLVYQRDGDTDRSLEWLAEARRRDPDRAGLWADSGVILRRERRFADAADCFREAVERNPRAHWWHLWRANSLRDAGDLKQARGLYEEMVKSFPDFSNAYYELAIVYSLLELYGEALAAIARAIELRNAPDVNFFRRAGMIAEQAARPDLAIHYNERLLESAPNRRYARESLARSEGP